MVKSKTEDRLHQGFRVRSLVEKNGLSIVNFAKKVGVSEQHMHRLFKEKYIPTKWLTKMCAILDVSIEGMFNEQMVVNDPFEPYTTKSAEVDKLKEEVAAMRERLGDKDGTIAALEALVDAINGTDRRKSKAS